MPSDIVVTVNGQPAIEADVLSPSDLLGVSVASTGDRGPKGDKGDTGAACSLKIGTVTGGADPAATITGNAPNQTLSLVLPQGPQGPQGDRGLTGNTGPAVNLTIGTVGKGPAAATITGTPPNQTLSLTLPQGETGERGAAGPYTTIQVGTTSTGSPGTKASVNSVTSGDTVTLNFTVPRGADGTANLGDETPQPLGIANPGTATSAARADHVHAIPTINYASLTSVPATFPPATHQHAISDVTNLQTVLDAKQPAGNYATLVSGTVPSSQLPGFVDDVVEYTNLAAFPSTGEVGKLFVARDTNRVYRWSGSTYVEIAASPGSTDSVPEGSTNKYFTVQRAADAAPVQSVNGKTGNVVIEAGGIAWSTAPTSTTTATKAGQISYDQDYVYVATAIDTWRRAGLEDWTTPTITISTQPSSQTAVGGAATFTVTASVTQGAELLYQWQRQARGAGGWVNVSDGLSPSLTLTNLQYAVNNGDKYRVIISSGAAGTGGSAVGGWLPAVVVELTPTASITSGEATLTVEAAISIVTQPQSVTLSSSTSASFSVSATTPGTGLAYQWQSSPDGTNWTNISGKTSTSLSFTGLTQSNDQTRYRCVVSSSGYDDATSKTALLTVNPITVTTQPANQTASAGAGTTPNYNAAFTAAGTSPAGPPSLQWQVSTDGGTTFSDISGETSSSLSITGLVWADSGKRYRVRLNKTGWSEVTSNSASLSVPVDTINITTQPANTTASVAAFSSTTYTLPSGSYNQISFANGQYWATPTNSDLGGDYLAVSGDAVEWTRRNLAFPNPRDWRPIQYANGLYLSRAQGTNVYATSEDGVTWTERAFPSSGITYDVKYIDGLGWVRAYNFGNAMADVSSNGITWTSLYTGTTHGITSDVRRIADKLVVGGRAAVIQSPAQIGSFSSQYASEPLIGHSSDAAIYGSSSQIKVVNYSGTPSATTLYLPAGAYEAYSAAYDAVRGRWAVVSDAGVFTTTGSSVPAFRLPLTCSTDSKVFVSPEGRLTLIRFVQSVSGYSVHTSDDGGISWTVRVSQGSIATPLGCYGITGRLYAVIGNQTVVAPGGESSASFTAAASTLFGSPSIQWQSSSDSGATWANVSGATASPFVFTPSSGDNGKRYRAVFSKPPYATVNSNSAILTVP